MVAENRRRRAAKPSRARRRGTLAQHHRSGWYNCQGNGTFIRCRPSFQQSGIGLTAASRVQRPMGSGASTNAETPAIGTCRVLFSTAAGPVYRGNRKCKEHWRLSWTNEPQLDAGWLDVALATSESACAADGRLMTPAASCHFVTHKDAFGSIMPRRRVRELDWPATRGPKGKQYHFTQLLPKPCPPVHHAVMVGPFIHGL